MDNSTHLEHRESHARFHRTWEALMRQLDRINSLAHLRHTQSTEGQEAVGIARSSNLRSHLNGTEKP